jgi:hypothetical protein
MEKTETGQKELQEVLEDSLSRLRKRLAHFTTYKHADVGKWLLDQLSEKWTLSLPTQHAKCPSHFPDDSEFQEAAIICKKLTKG